MEPSKFLNNVKSVFLSMGLKVFKGTDDFPYSKPELIAVYEEIKKYYVIQAITESSFTEPNNSIDLNVADEDSVRYYLNLLERDKYLTSIAISIMFELTEAISNTLNTSVKEDLELTDMTCYAGIVTDIAYYDSIEKVLNVLEIENKSLDIIDQFQLILISKEDTIKLQKGYNQKSHIAKN